MEKTNKEKVTVLLDVVDTVDYATALHLVTCLTCATEEQLLSDGRGTQNLASARQLLYWILFTQAGCNHSAIARKLSRHRSVVSAGVKAIDAIIAYKFGHFKHVKDNCNAPVESAAKGAVRIAGCWQAFLSYFEAKDGDKSCDSATLSKLNRVTHTLWAHYNARS